MELREMEIFLTLAEELHFGRTAARLRVTPSRVSQAIRKQERAIGAPLFERTSRTVRLTEAGRFLHERLRPAFDAVHEAVAATTAYARNAPGTLTLGVMGAQAHELADALRRFRERHPAAEVAFREIRFTDPFGALRDGEVDLLATWLPVEEPDLDVRARLHTEPLVLLVAEHHPLAVADAGAGGPVDVEVLAEYTTPSVPGPVPRYWLDAILPERTPRGRATRPGPEVATFEEILALAAAGEVICPAADEARRYYQRPGVVYLPLAGAAPVRWALVSRAGALPPLARGFVEAVRAGGAGES